MLAGLNAIHKKKIIHRDLKPENLLLTKDKKIKITDMGLIKEFNKNTVFGPLSLEDIRMLTSIKGLFDVGDFNESITILINGVEGLLDESNSAFVHRVPDWV